MRQPTRSWELDQQVQRFREEYPWWGKDNLAVLTRRAHVSTSMVGRILSWLRAREMLKEPPGPGVATRRRHGKHPYGARKPREYQAKVPGDIVQVDTLHVRPIPGVILKRFTARDVVSRCDVLEAHTRATARLAAQFLGSLRGRKPFPVRAIRVDGGSEFQAGFESACQGPGIKLFVLPPRCPKRNGHVERAQHTHTEEFYHLYKGDLAITSLNQALLAWEGVYNTVRCPGSFDCPLMSLRAHRGNLEAVSTNAVASSLLAATIR